MLQGMNLEGWCSPTGVCEFNRQNPPLPGVRWHVVAGSFYDDPLGGAFWEGLPNDGMVSLASAMSFLALCPDSVSCEALVLPIKHPDWNWGENLLESRGSSIGFSIASSRIWSAIQGFRTGNSRRPGLFRLPAQAHRPRGSLKHLSSCRRIR